MFTNGMFSVSYAGQVLLVFLVPALIGIFFSVAAVVARRRASQEAKQEAMQSRLDWAIGIFALTGPLEIVGLMLIHFWSQTVGESVAISAILLWPLSTLIASRARGFGRKEILFGSSLVGLWLFGLGVVMSIH